MKSNIGSPWWLLLFLASALVAIFLAPSHPTDAAPAAPDADWHEPTHVSTDSGEGAFAPVVRMAPNGTVMVMYNHEGPAGEGTPYTPYYRRSTDGGRTWQAPGTAYSGSASAAQVDFAFDGNSRAHAVWRTDAGLYYASESNWPTTGTLVRSSTVDSVIRRIDTPAIAVDPDDGTIFIVWLQAVGADNETKDVFYRYSRDGGTTWTPTPLEDDDALTTVGDGSGSAAPDVAFDAVGNVHIVWEESYAGYPIPDIRNEIFYLKGTRTAANIYTFGTGPAILSYSDGDNNGQDDSDSSYQPSIEAEGNNLYVVFEDRQDAGEEGDQANARISPYYIENLGSGWSTPQRVIGANDAFYVNTRLPFYLGTALTVCEGTAHVYYHGSKSENSVELVWGTNNQFDTWTTPQAITSVENRHTNPSVTCQGSNLYLSFERIISSSTNHQIYYTDNTAGGIFLPILFK